MGARSWGARARRNRRRGGGGRARARGARRVARATFHGHPRPFARTTLIGRGKERGHDPRREAGRDPRARRTSVVLLVVRLHAVHRGEERPEGDDEREHRQRHERVPHLLRERQIARHLRERLRAVPPEPVPALGAPRPRGPRAARRLDDLPRPARPRRAVATARFRRFRHRARVTARVASRRVRARPSGMPMRAETVSARGRSGSFPATRGCRSRLAVGSGTVERAARSSPARSNLTSGIERKSSFDRRSNLGDQYRPREPVTCVHRVFNFLKRGIKPISVPAESLGHERAAAPRHDTLLSSLPSPFALRRRDRGTTRSGTAPPPPPGEPSTRARGVRSRLGGATRAAVVPRRSHLARARRSPPRAPRRRF